MYILYIIQYIYIYTYIYGIPCDTGAPLKWHMTIYQETAVHKRAATCAVCESTWPRSVQVRAARGSSHTVQVRAAQLVVQAV